MKCCSDKSSCVSRCLKIGVMILAGVAALSWVTMQLWNCLLPNLFVGVSPISYWQALGLLILCKILFGGMRCGGHGHWRAHQGHSGLTQEERQQFKEKFRNRWSACCSSSKDPAEQHNALSGNKQDSSQ